MEHEFKTLCSILQENYLLNTVVETLLWDQETNLPTQGHDFRGKQVAWLSKMAHECLTSDKMAQVVGKLHSQIDEYGTSPQHIIIREAYKDYQKFAKVPSSLVEKRSETIVKSHGAWVKSRKEKKFATFAPFMEELVELYIQEANYLDAHRPAYDVILEQNEPGFTMEKIDSLFGRLKKELVQMISQIKQDVRPLTGPFDLKKQSQVARKIAQDIGFDFTCGREDISIHPFTATLGPKDVRITTRHKKDNLEGIYSTIHEVGHGLYEQNLSSEYFGTPLGVATSVAVHESQSRFWEVFVGKSRTFIEKYFAHFQEAFPSLQDWTPGEFYRSLNRVHSQPIRVNADELTYHLHIIIRYEIEKDLFSRKMVVADVPRVWNEKMKYYLGVDVANDLEGALQDIHWAQGIFGYFPTYTLGSIYAAQFVQTMEEQIDFSAQVAQGNFAQIREWLQQNVFHVGRSLHGDQLIEKITGRELSERYIVEHLRDKWSNELSCAG